MFESSGANGYTEGGYLDIHNNNKLAYSHQYKHQVLNAMKIYNITGAAPATGFPNHFGAVATNISGTDSYAYFSILLSDLLTEF